jgi:antitoxin component YwqK of YwqJK toxin-antitoxin module
MLCARFLVVAGLIGLFLNGCGPSGAPTSNVEGAGGHANSLATASDGSSPLHEAPKPVEAPNSPDVVVVRFPDGAVSEIWQIRKDGEEVRRHGVYLSLDSSGTTLQIGAYHEGQKNGAWRSFHPNGEIWWYRKYNLGAKIGTWREYFETGAVAQIQSYLDDKAEGPFEARYEDGTLRQCGTYTKGEKQGEWKTYFDNGALETVEHFVFGIWDGDQIDYFRSGTRMRQRVFNRGVKTREYQWNSDGELIMWWPDRPKDG